MATIIDTLIVKLGLDSSGFDAGKKKVDKGLGDTGAAADKTGAKFNETAKMAAKFMAVIGGTMAIKRFIETTIESNAALDRLSQNLGTSATNISAWSNAAEQAGGSASGLQGTMDMLSKSQTELMLTGESGLVPYFSALGVGLADAQGKAKPVGAILLDLADKFSKMPRTTANNMGRMMGIDQGTMQLLLKGRAEVELMLRRQRESNAVTKQQAEESTKLKRIMVESRQTFEAFGRELVSMAMPALEKFFELFSAFGDWVHENQEFVKNFLTLLAGGLAAVGAAMIPINLTVIAVVALTAAIAALWQDYSVWKRGGDSLIDWAKWKPGVDAAITGIGWIKNALGDLIFRAFAAGDAMGAIMSGDWDRAKRAGQLFLEGNGQPYAPAAPPVGAVPSGGAGGAAGAMAYFQSQGWSKEQAAGLAANIQQESNFNPAAVGDNGKAYGIAQWHPDRQAKFKDMFGKDIKGSTFEDQLAFMEYELQTTERRAGDLLRAARTAPEAAAIVSRNYERPADASGEATRRGTLAAAMIGGIPGAGAAAGGAGASTAAAGARVVQNTIGEVKVYTAATDAQGIAQDMGKSLNYLFVSQANSGLQ